MSEKAGPTTATDSESTNAFVRLKMGAWLEEFDCEVESRSTRLRMLAKDEAMGMRHELDVKLMSLPNRVRNMPLRDFKEIYGCSLQHAIRNIPHQNAPESAKKKAYKAMSATERAATAASGVSTLPSTPAASTSSQHGAASAKTPLAPRTAQRITELQQRSAKKSTNTSALASKSHRVQAAGAVPFTPNTEKKFAKENAREHIRRLQEELNSLMVNLESPLVRK